MYDLSNSYDQILLAVADIRDAELSKLLNVSRTTVWRARTGRTALSRSTRAALEKLLEQNVDKVREVRAIDALFRMAISRSDVRDVLASIGEALLHNLHQN